MEEFSLFKNTECGIIVLIIDSVELHGINGGDRLTRKKDKMNDPISLRLDDEIEVMVEAIAKLQNEAKADVMRRLIREGARAELANQVGAVDQMLKLIRTAIRETNKPFEERVAKLMAKSSIASATSMYTTMEVLGQLGRQDVAVLYKEARKKAVAYVRTPEPDDSTVQSKEGLAEDE